MLSFKYLTKLFLNDIFILALIIINAFILIIEGFNLDESVLNTVILLDNIVTFLFLMELVLKINHFGMKKYLADRWNVFDAVIVIVSLPSLIAYLFGISASTLSAILVLRVFRLFKLFRLMRFVPDIDRLLAGVARAARASVVVVLGFFIYTFILGIISFYLFSGAGTEYFSNPLTSIYSVFRIFTIEGWFEIPDALAASYQTTGAVITYLYFTAVLFSGGIIGLSLINSIFVEEMMSDNNTELEEQVKRLEGKIDELLKKTK